MIRIKTLVNVLIILAIAGYAYANLSNGVDNPVTEIKNKIVNLASGKSSGSDSVTIKVGTAGHLLNGQVMISVSQIVKNEKVGNGAAFAVALPHRTLTAHVKAGKRIQIQVSGVTYFLDFVSVSDSSATFQIVKGVQNNDDES